MLTDEEVAALAADPETDRVERKSSLSGSAAERVKQAVCAFANDLPGYGRAGVVIIGQQDDGSSSGTPITDHLLQQLGALRSDGNILPLPTLVVRKLTLGGSDVAVVIVAPSADTPVRYDGRVWIRVGPRRAVASRDEERILVERRQARDVAFDQRSVGGTDLKDLDLEFFQQSYLPAAVSPDVIAENERSLEHQLSALHLLTRSGEPNAAALLLLGKDPRTWLPSAYVQFVRFDGEDLAAPILDQKELSGRLDTLLRRVDDLIRLNVRTRTNVEGSVTEVQRPDYPVAALQQLLRNAVMHRSYEVNAPVYWYWFKQHMEIHSPGGLYGRVTPENFGSPGVTDYRNQVLAEGLKVTGFVQRFGMGVALAQRRCAENGNPAPTFEFQPSAVMVRVDSNEVGERS